MPTQFGSIACFKASRDITDAPRLDLARVASNSRRGIQTSLLLDTNVLINMAEACDPSMPANDETLQRCKLLEFTEFLRECHRLGLTYYISPFLGLRELPNNKVAVHRAAVDAFSQKFDLNWIDSDPTIVEVDLSTLGRFVDRDRFMSLDDVDRKILSLYYAGLLLMLVVERDSHQRPPFIKFKRYLRHYRRRIDLVSMRTIAIARFVFAPTPDRESPLYEPWEKIVLNFTQRERINSRYPTTLHQMDKAALNGAHDLLLLDAALVGEARGIGGADIDPWIVSRDMKLCILARTIHHTGPNRRLAGQYAVMQSLVEHGDYWSRTEEEVSRLAARFRKDVDTSPDRLERRALGVISLAEHGLV